MVNALGLKNQDDWKRWSCTERPPDIPGNPWMSYKNAGWNGFADWLGQPNEQIYTYVIGSNNVCTNLYSVIFIKTTFCKIHAKVLIDLSYTSPNFHSLTLHTRCFLTSSFAVKSGCEHSSGVFTIIL